MREWISYIFIEIKKEIFTTKEIREELIKILIKMQIYIK